MLARCAIAVLVPALAYGHAHLLSPAPRNDAANKTGPCGAARTNTPVTLEAGSELEVKWTETIQHSGHYIVSFSPNGDTGFTPLPLLDGGVANNIPNPMGLTSLQSDRVRLPTTPCTDCTLQLIQVMTESTPPSNYYSCADLVLVSPPPTDGGSPEDAGPPVADAGSGSDAGASETPPDAATPGQLAPDAGTPAPAAAEDERLVALGGCSSVGPSGWALATLAAWLGWRRRANRLRRDA